MANDGSFGSWSSPITADAVVTESVSLSEPRIDGDDIYWIEGRPFEKGRNVVVARAADGTIRDITPSPFDARSQVYGYGGGAYAVHDRVVYFVNFGDNQIYRQAPGAAPTKITSNSTSLFADICVDAGRNRLIAIREERPNGDVINAINTLVAVDIETGAETTLESGYDFYSSPVLSPDGSKLAWLSWRHPNMPWTSTDLNVASLDKSGMPTDKQSVYGNAKSIFQPQWSPDGRLYFISDRTDFWNLYRWSGSGVEHILARDAEFGVPQWNLGLSTYAFASQDMMIYSFVKNGTWRLGRLEISTLTASDYPMEFSSLSGIHATATTVVAALRHHRRRRLRLRQSTVSTGAVSPIKILGSARQLSKIPKLLLQAATDRISDQRRRYRPRLLLPSLQSGLAGARFGKTSLAREEPWRADHRDRFGSRSFRAILDQPGLWPSRRELSWKLRVRQEIPGKALWPVGRH